MKIQFQKFGIIAGMVLGFLNFGSTEARAGYYDYRNGNTYYCSEVGGGGSEPECRYDSQCQQGYTCSAAGSCVKTAVTCIPHCIRRSYDGTCYSYGTDFCGVNPVCVESCIRRSPDGTCYAYDPDTCY